jgi:hypothetical protein
MYIKNRRRRKAINSSRILGCLRPRPLEQLSTEGYQVHVRLHANHGSSFQSGTVSPLMAKIFMSIVMPII